MTTKRINWQKHSNLKAKMHTQVFIAVYSGEQVWTMSPLFIEIPPVKQYSYRNDFNGVFDALLRHEKTNKKRLKVVVNNLRCFYIDHCDTGDPFQGLSHALTVSHCCWKVAFEYCTTCISVTEQSTTYTQGL